MPPEIIRWLPLACVLGACFWLWSSARPAPYTEEKSEETVALAVPEPPKDYEPPPVLNGPFLNEAPTEAAAKPGQAAHRVPSQGASVRLEGIFWDADSPMASINGRSLKEGESYGRLRVVNIAPDRVTVQVDGKLKVLPLTPTLSVTDEAAPGPQGRPSASRGKTASDDGTDNSTTDETP
jgi:hypothetical protein